MTNPWSGRFEKPLATDVAAYTASLDVDRRLAPYDVAGSIAHARMLGRQGIIPQSDADAIVRGLLAIRAEIERGDFPLRPELEDIHMNIEVRLRELVGEPADRLHTARSRNDQVATAFRLYVRDSIDRAVAALRRLQTALVDVAETHFDIVMPGYTHLQRAQPVLWAHHLLAYFEMFDRDADRFRDCRRRVDVLPLGSGALAGVPYPIDREYVARELGFARVSDNSIDATADRDFAAEFVFAAAMTLTHVSRLAEEIVLWASAEFGFIALDDAFATGSSIMPQKKNPDVAELARGRSGRAYGALINLLTTLKALPLAYNRDLQEDKQALFTAEDALIPTLAVMAEMLPTLRPDPERMRKAASASYALATDVADYLTRKGLPFRQAHHIVGRLVRWAEERQKELPDLTLDEYRQFSPLFDEDILRLDLDASLASRDVPGGTAPRRVQEALLRARERLKTVQEAHRP